MHHKLVKHVSHVKHGRHKQCNRKTAGFSLLETIAAVTVLTIALLFTIQAVLATARISTSVSTHATFQEKSRWSLDQLSQDVAASCWTMAQYPVTGTATYTADCNKTLILCLPPINADGSLNGITTGTPTAPIATPANYDYIIYRVVQPPAANLASDGPWELTRQVIHCATSSRTDSTTIIAKNIPYDPTDPTMTRPWVSITYVATQSLPGTASTCINALTTVCTLATSISAPAPAVATTEVLANGTDKTSTTIIVGAVMTTTPAIATPTPPNPTPSGYTTPQYINVRYAVNPVTLDTQVSPSNGRNYAGQVIFTLHQKGVAESGNAINDATIPTSVMTTAATLRNRPALQ